MGMISALVDNLAVVWFLFPAATAQQARTVSIGRVKTVGNIMKPTASIIMEKIT
jgi:hypothetical protein